MRVIKLSKMCSPYKDGWSWPKKIGELIKFECQGTTLQLFGGKATFGTRLDIDPSTNPDIVGNAWLPPFGVDSFDYVVLDPPYNQLNQQEKHSLFMTAGAIARKGVVWFHVLYDCPGHGLRVKKEYIVLARSSQARVLIFFEKTKPIFLPSHFDRGPAIKYNRWLAQPQGLAFT